jgi:rhodanese-related sulfurtransferase
MAVRETQEHARLEATTHVAGADGRFEYLPDELSDRLRRAADGEVIVLDVRPDPEYAAAHLPGAVHIPLGELAGRINELPADREVIAYCRGAYCALAHDAVRLLTAHGRKARRATDGVLEWRVAGLPVETGNN